MFAKAAVEAGPVTVGASWTVVGSGVDPATYPVGNPTGALVSVQAADQFGLTVTAGASAVVDVEECERDLRWRCYGRYHAYTYRHWWWCCSCMVLLPLHP